MLHDIRFLVRPNTPSNSNEQSNRQLREAEFAVASAISVREQQKARLEALMSSLSSESGEIKSIKRPSLLRPGNSSIINQLHLIGDLLLLLRAASVNVVERIQVWRQQVHHGKPRPYTHEKQNYLLAMCEDTDFLNEAQVLIAWLGFPLRRNPFIIRECLEQDAEFGQRQNSPSGWTSRSEPDILKCQRIKLPAGKHPKPKPQHQSKLSPPPEQLVLPLASILPSDNPVDGARITAARRILLDEESFFGSATVLQASTKSLKTCSEIKITAEGTIHQYQHDIFKENCTIYDQLSFVKASSSVTEKAAARIQVAHATGVRALTQLRLHMRWIDSCRQDDRTIEHHVWRCRDRYREDVLKKCAGIEHELQNALDNLSSTTKQLQQVAGDQIDRLHELEKQKVQQRAAQKLAGAEQRVPNNINPKKKRCILKKKTLKQPLKVDDKQTGDMASSPVSIEAEVSKMMTEQHSQRKPILDEKRVLAWRERDLVDRSTVQGKGIARDDLNRRRLESAMMKHEDDRSHLLQIQQARQQHFKQQKSLLAQISATSIYKCSHEMNGKTFLVSVYEQKPRGYFIDGIRITAYDPVTSSTFALHMCLREFDSLGYGRSKDGLRVFCKWLCLLYEKRKQKHRLIWVGAPCPPPMRSRDYDRALICAHKEGLKLGGNRYALAAVYVRTNEPSTLRFVIGSIHTTQLIERAINVRNLFDSDDLHFSLEDCWGEGRCFAEWNHHRGKRIREQVWHQEPQHLFVDHGDADVATAHAIYTGPTMAGSVSAQAYIYDANEAEYVVDVHLNNDTHEHYHRLTVLKHEVNPYGVSLPTTSFGDLVQCLVVDNHDLDIGNFEINTSTASYSSKRATVSSKWFTKLTKYVRVVRLGRFGCKAGAKFCLATIYLVQLKTEFRAQLLIELITLSNDQDDRVKHSIRIALSDYLRCTSVIRRLGLIDASTPEQCAICTVQHFEEPQSENQNNSTHLLSHLHHENGWVSYCPGCIAGQAVRISALRDCLMLLVTHMSDKLNEDEFSVAITLLYRVHCEECGENLPPLLVIFKETLLPSTCEMLEYYHLRCFDYVQVLSCPEPRISESNEFGKEQHKQDLLGQGLVDDFRRNASTNRVTVLSGADFGYTVASANAFTNELCAKLYPDASVLPCQLFFALLHASEDLQHQSRDQDVVGAVATMRNAAIHLGEVSGVVSLGDHNDASESGLGFDTYLVTEALLIEALRVVLEPHSQWRTPSTTVGASSWSTACEVLRNPWHLSQQLQQADIFAHNQQTQQVLLAYFSHTSWPHSYDDVRPIFYQVLTFMMHIEHVYQLITARGGLLINVHTNHSQAESQEEGTIDTKPESTLHAQTQVLFLW